MFGLAIGFSPSAFVLEFFLSAAPFEGCQLHLPKPTLSLHHVDVSPYEIMNMYIPVSLGGLSARDSICLQIYRILLQLVGKFAKGCTCPFLSYRNFGWKWVDP